MGMFSKMLKKAEEHLNKSAEPPRASPEKPPTRWERAVVCSNGVVGKVVKIDKTGVDVICFPGTDGADMDVYREVKDTKGLEKLVTSKEPSGDCMMGATMDTVLKEAFERGFEEKPTSILVLTAGRPDDHEALTKTLRDAANKVSKPGDLTVTFVQIGDDETATKYLTHLDDELKCTSESGEEIDIVDTIKDDDIKGAMKEMKGGGSSGTAGAIMGAFAGAAIGVGGVYLSNKMNAKKRTEGWNGKWRAVFEGEEIYVLTVKDDGEGNLAIEGWADEATSTGEYAENEEGGFNIQFTQPDDDEIIYGHVEDEHNITWSDGTRWEEVEPDGGHWAAYTGAAVAGAATAGTAGYLMEKKFFGKASKGEAAEYVIILDRSKMMAIPDPEKN